MSEDIFDCHNWCEGWRGCYWQMVGRGQGGCWHLIMHTAALCSRIIQQQTSVVPRLRNTNLDRPLNNALHLMHFWLTAWLVTWPLTPWAYPQLGKESHCLMVTWRRHKPQNCPLNQQQIVAASRTSPSSPTLGTTTHNRSPYVSFICLCVCPSAITVSYAPVSRERMFYCIAHHCPPLATISHNSTLIHFGTQGMAMVLYVYNSVVKQLVICKYPLWQIAANQNVKWPDLSTLPPFFDLCKLSSP